MSTSNVPDDAHSSVIGNELRHRREAARLSQEEFARQIHSSRSLVQAIETGRRVMTPDVADACDRFLAADGLFARLRKDVARQMAPWPSFRPWQDVEREATRLRGYELATMPGLFQTAGYAAVVLENDEDAIAARLERQEIFSTSKPPSVRYLLDEWVLRRPVGEPSVMVDQLERLLQIIDDGLATIQVVPSGAVPIYNGSFVLATLAEEPSGAPCGHGARSVGDFGVGIVVPPSASSTTAATPQVADVGADPAAHGCNHLCTGVGETRRTGSKGHVRGRR